jgi:hypothetical protein
MGLAVPADNAHLVRNVGGLSLALTVVFAAAAVVGQWLLSAVAVGRDRRVRGANTIFQFLHLETFPTLDAVAQTIGIAFHVLVIAGVVWLLWRGQGRTSRP